MAQLSAIRDHLEYILNIETGDAYIDSADQLRHINEGYREAAYRHDFPELYLRRATVLVANVNRYDTPTAFRKFDYVFNRGSRLEETDLASIHSASNKYAVDKNTSQIIISDLPTTASTPYTTSNSETAGSAVVIELDTVSGLSAGEEIYINGTTPEFASISSVDTTNTTITISFKNNITAGNIIYKSSELLIHGFYRTVTDLSDAADTPILPSVFHTIIPYFGAYLFHMDKLEDEKAEKYLKLFDRRMADAFLAFDKTSTGESNQFVI